MAHEQKPVFIIWLRGRFFGKCEHSVCCC